MTIVIILFFISPGIAFPQCKKQYILNQSVTFEGVGNNIDNYYQNLIIQDIALANQLTFGEISLRIDYTIHYVADQCKPEQYEISVLPVEVKCFPVFYYGYDISSSIKPEKADLVFHLIRHDGFVSDSLIFYEVPVENDSGLYISLAAARNPFDESLSVVFARAVFHYARSSYEGFRDRILQIDQYFAASLIADSARVWAADGFLSETGNKAEMIMRQLELERIINYISPEKFSAVFTAGINDFNGLTFKYHDLVRINNRMKAIISYNRFESGALEKVIRQDYLLNNYLERFDHYHRLAFKADFRFVNFIDGLASPYFSNSSLFALQQAFACNYEVTGNVFRPGCRHIVQGFINRGDDFEREGNQLRALSYYESACHISQLMRFHDYQSVAFNLVGRMKNDISTSYLEISKKFALTENPVMAAQYFRDARAIFAGKDYEKLEPDFLREYDNWLFQNLESQAVRYIELKNYSKAIAYLNEIQSQCLSAISYPCPEQFHNWMRTVRDGIYHDLLHRAQSLLLADELPEAEQTYRQATATRMMAGYRIEKDMIEEELERSFRQIRYDELFEEGLRNFGKEAFSDALFYFNKASFLERSCVSRFHPDLSNYRQEAARKVIETVLSDGRLKAWAYDFEGAGVALDQVKSMLSEYKFSESDTLSHQLVALEKYIHQNECEKIFREYIDLMAQVKDAREKNEFILALKIARDAVSLSMDHIGCRIRDDEAWYQKILLEPPADFQQKEKEMEGLAYGSCDNYLKAFQELKNIYYRNKLLEQGVVFISLYDRVIRSKDSSFLVAMLDHYIKLKDLESSCGILKHMHKLGFSASPLENQQKSVAELLARRDALNPGKVDPLEKLDFYTGQDKWYQAFRRSYKLAWLKSAGWKLKYWPLIWKK